MLNADLIRFEFTFVFVYLFICICVFVHLYLCICAFVSHGSAVGSFCGQLLTWSWTDQIFLAGNLSHFLPTAIPPTLPFPIFRVTQMSFKVRTFLLAPEHQLAIFGIWGQIFWGGIFQDFTHGSFGDGGGVL